MSDWATNEVRLAQVTERTDGGQLVVKLGCRVVAARHHLEPLQDALEETGVPTNLALEGGDGDGDQEETDGDHRRGGTGSLFFGSGEYGDVVRAADELSQARVIPPIKHLSQHFLHILEAAAQVPPALILLPPETPDDKQAQSDGKRQVPTALEVPTAIEVGVPDWVVGVSGAAWARLKDYQRAGVEFAFRHDGRILLGDGMGLGKTAQAVVSTCLYRNKWPVLVLCPSSIRENLQSEFAYWADLPNPTDIVVVNSGKHLVQLFGPPPISTKTAKKRPAPPAIEDAKQSKRARLNEAGEYRGEKSGLPRLEAQVYIVSYGLVTQPGLLDSILQHRFKVLVCDESSYLKHMSKRTRAVLRLAWKAQHVLLLSGTPGFSGSDLYPQLLALRPRLWPVWWTPPKQQVCTQERLREMNAKLPCSFAARYCDPRPQRVAGGRWEYVLTGSARLDELHAIGHHFCFLQRLKEDVLHELPPKRRERISFAVPEKDRLEMAKVMDEMGRVQKDNKLRYRALFSKLFNQLPVVKSAFVRKWLDDFLADFHDKVLLFAHHKVMIADIAEVVKHRKRRSITITGATPANKRQTLVNQFQREPDCTVAILSLTAAGVGLNLHAANTVVICELLFGPDVLLQAEDRAHRLGQTRPVTVRYLTADDTLEDVVWRIVQRKQANGGRLMVNKAGRFAADRTQHLQDPNNETLLDGEVAELIAEAAPQLELPNDD